MEKFSLGCYHMNKALIENKRILEEILGTTSHHHPVTNNNGPNNRNINPPIKSMEILSKNLRYSVYVYRNKYERLVKMNANINSYFH